MKGLISALQFITAIPVGKNAVFEPSAMIAHFPVVGLILGAVVCVFDMAAVNLWPVSVVAVLDVVLLIFLTGALHIDGLGDTADGLYGRRSRQDALRIMKDSRIGAMGLVAVLCGLAVKWGGLASLDHHRALMIVVIPSFARSSMIFGMYFLEYGRPDGGTGRAFFEKALNKNVFRYMALPLILSVFAGLQGLFVITAFVAITFGILYFYKVRMGCITGDMLGAMCEICEAGLFILVSAWRF